jgi:thiol-disulfide isomerase/thioredoxin
VTIAPTVKPQVVMFLAHWCPHCQAEVPRIVDLAKMGAFKGIDVAAVATGTSPEAPNYPPSAWLKRENWPFPVMVDSASGTAAEAFGLSSYPYFVFVDAQGAVVGRAAGEIPPSDLQKILNALEAGNPLPKGSGASSSA